MSASQYFDGDMVYRKLRGRKRLDNTRQIRPSKYFGGRPEQLSVLCERRRQRKQIEVAIESIEVIYRSIQGAADDIIDLKIELLLFADAGKISLIHRSYR